MCELYLNIAQQRSSGPLLQAHTDLSAGVLRMLES
jgi:hypothetical protein